ncbi:MjaI family restriction endonuclease [Empedobacter falsenii]|uniref:MjaI family restriction endonuclease n=1 Tax=Empedobacter stercoris TaxID=1628248 RepID=A0ABX1WLE8_9FLAO|nr:MjaI family restriction endonuclease [Empedobacter stercoris]NOJ75474.1 MjaI family restriction endonuclease [Empedobacter stercoris]
MKKTKISNSELQSSLSGKTYIFPKYTTQIMNLANSNAQGTRPKVVGQMSDLIQEFPGNNIREWEEWYLANHPDAINNATSKIWNMIQEFQKVIGSIDENMIKEWVEELVIVKTYSGLKFQDAILKRVAEETNSTYRLANPEEESKGIDGYVNNKAISVKPISYKTKNLSENIEEPIIFYDKKKDGISIEYDL